MDSSEQVKEMELDTNEDTSLVTVANASWQIYPWGVRLKTQHQGPK